MNTALNKAHQQPQPQPNVIGAPPAHFFEGFMSAFSRMYRQEMENVPTISWHRTDPEDNIGTTALAQKEVQGYLDALQGFERIVSAKALFLCALNSHTTARFLIHYSVLPGVSLPGQPPNQGHTLWVYLLKEPNEACHLRNLLMEANGRDFHRLEAFAEELSALGHQHGWQCRKSKSSEGAHRLIELIRWK